jgi:hypothetical protein
MTCTEVRKFTRIVNSVMLVSVHTHYLPLLPPLSKLDYPGSCGRCYEVKCKPAEMYDGFGEFLLL